jgi:hypothetical protein
VLYEFALTPDVFDVTTLDGNSTLSVTLVELLRGACENGLLANLHRDQWLKYVEARIEKLSPALKDRILSCFKVLHDL